MRRSRRVLVLVVAVALGGCHGSRSLRGAPIRRPPALGRRVLVLAPHPDDEVLGAAGLIDEAVRSGARVRVVVATDGEAGVDDTGVRDLPLARRAETRLALSDLGLGPDALVFLGFADGSLGGSWTEAWSARRRETGPTSSNDLLDALRAAVRDAAADTIVVPMPLDAHADHRALNRFALLAVLGEQANPDWPHIMGYLIHARGWPADPAGFTGCPGSTFPWTGLPLGQEGELRKAALVAEYRSQIGRSRSLLRFARRTEPFAREDVIRAPAAMNPTRPGVRRTAREISIRVPRAPCAAHPEARDRLRLRFFGTQGLRERVVDFVPVVGVRGGTPGGPLAPAGDLSPKLTPGSIQLRLAASAFGDVRGGLLEVLPGDAERIGPAWLLVW